MADMDPSSASTVTWKPSVTPLATQPRPQPTLNEPTMLTKTSLAHNQPPQQHIGHGSNFNAKPFQVAGDGMPKLLHKQYNSPINLYSNKNIAETIKAHSEMLAPGVVGINFMKADTPVNKDSAVYKAILEEEAAKQGKHCASPSTPQSVQSRPHFIQSQTAGIAIGDDHHHQTYIRDTSPTLQSQSFRRLQQSLGSDDIDVEQQQRSRSPAPVPGPVVHQNLGQNICHECGRLIVGVFCKINDKKLHEECFRCSTCGNSLKNLGYYNVNDKLYCNLHAEQALKTSQRPTRIIEPNRPNPISHPISHPIRSVSPTSIGSPTPSFMDSSRSYQETRKTDLPSSYATLPRNQASSYSSYNSSLYQSKPVPYPGPSAHSEPLKPTTVSAPKFNWPKSGGQGNQYESNVSSETTTSNTGSGQTIHKLTTSFEQTRISDSAQSNGYQPVQAPQLSLVQLPAPASGSCVSPSCGSVPIPVKIPPSTLPKPQLSSSSWMNRSSSTTTTSSTGTGTSGTLGSNIGGQPGQFSLTGSKPAPRRGRGQLRTQESGIRLPFCSLTACGQPIRGPFIVALGKTWCPDHFICANQQCKRSLQDSGFVEEQGQLYCENCFEQYFAPNCAKCNVRIKGDCLVALGKQYHPQCFVCAYCKKPFANTTFYLEDGLPYCEKDWNELFTTKCIGCGYAIEAGDRWVEALNNNYHSQCFKCTVCHQNLEGQSFYAKGGKPYCKSH